MRRALYRNLIIMGYKSNICNLMTKIYIEYFSILMYNRLK